MLSKQKFASKKTTAYALFMKNIRILHKNPKVSETKKMSNYFTY